MKQLILDGSLGMDAIHDLLARELSFPHWYGRNLDALYDCLTDLSEDASFDLVNLDELGFRGRALACVFRDAAHANCHIHLKNGQNP